MPLDTMLRRLLVLVPLLAPAWALAVDKDGFEDSFNPDPAQFSPTGKNDYFNLEPGHQLILEGTEEGKTARLVITVLDEIKRVEGIDTRVIEEHESLDGKPVEISRNFFAIDKKTNDVYYFGEEVDEYKNGKIAAHPGSWISGKDGAHYGLFMPAAPKQGQKAYQELAPKVAMDRFEVTSVSEKVTVPAGTFENCVKMQETTPLEPEVKEYKLYARGAGLLTDGSLKLVKQGKNIELRKQKQANAKKQAKRATTQKDPNAPEPLVPHDLAREALGSVGADPNAEVLWVTAINDPALTEHQRSDLIEDLNEEGFADPKHVTAEELPLVMSRLALIEQLAPDAMDQTNYDAFMEAHKDLTNIANRLTQQ